MSKLKRNYNPQNNIQRTYDKDKYSWKIINRYIKWKLNKFVDSYEKKESDLNLAEQIYYDFTDCSEDIKICENRYKRAKYIITNKNINIENVEISLYGNKVFIDDTKRFSNVCVKILLYSWLKRDLSRLRRKQTKEKINQSLLQYYQEYELFLKFSVDYLKLYKKCLFANSIYNDWLVMKKQSGWKNMIFYDWLHDFGINDEEYALNFLSWIGYQDSRKNLVNTFIGIMLTLFLDNNLIDKREFKIIRNELFEAYFSKEIKNKIIKKNNEKVAYTCYNSEEKRVCLKSVVYKSVIDLYQLEKPQLYFQIIHSSNNHITKRHCVSNEKIKLAVKSQSSFKLLEYSCHYCSNCNVYFDFNNAFDIQLEKIGLKKKDIYVKLINNETNVFDNYNMFKQESLLHFLGYKVGKSGLDSYSRKKLLKKIIDERIMRVAEIKEIINRNINMFQSKSNMEIAVNDWESDLEFIISMHI